MSRCSTLRKIARSSANPCLRSLATASITARQPVSVHKRSNTRAGPIRRTVAVASSCAALSTIAWVANRAPERTSRSN